MSFFRKLFFTNKNDNTDPQISLDDWLKQRNLVPSSHLLVIYRSETERYTLLPDHNIEQSDKSVVHHRVVILGENEYQATFEGIVPSTVINKDYRFTRLGKYVLIMKRKLPHQCFLYIEDRS